MKKLLIFASLVLITLVLMVSCADKTGYKTLTTNKGIGHFSFEYPSKYKVDGYYITKDYTDIDLSDIGLGEKDSEPIFQVFIFPNDGSNPEPSHTIKQDIDTATRHADFRLLEQTTVTFSGIQAEQITYTYISAPDTSAVIKGIDPWPIFVKEIFFTKAGAVWWLTFAYNQISSEVDLEIREDFDQILQTFKFLP
jgi:hypothetical protein